MNEELKQHLEAMETRLAQHILHEVGTRIDEVKARIDDMDRRLRRVDANTITTMELLARQSRWHEESDNAIHDMIKRQGDTEKKLDELRVRVEKLEGGGKAA